MNQSFVMFKPDCLARDLTHEIKKLIKSRRFIIEKEMDVVVTKAIILKHYAEVIERLNSDTFKQSILDAFVGKTVHVMQITNITDDCIDSFRALVGATDPAKAKPDSIRGLFGEDTMEKSKAEGRMLNNLIHASDSAFNAQRELDLWFN